MTEKTLVLIKPDAVKKSISGKILSKFEDAGLKIVGIKMVWADENLARNHYYLDETWARSVYEKKKKSCEEQGKEFLCKDPLEIGKQIQQWNAEYLMEGPVIAMVLEGNYAVEIVRKLVGSTEPKSSAPGTIRGDFASTESYGLADYEKRVLRTLVHASDSPDNAKREIALWFNIDELHSNYKTIHDFLLREYHPEE